VAHLLVKDIHNINFFFHVGLVLLWESLIESPTLEKWKSYGYSSINTTLHQEL